MNKIKFTKNNVPCIQDFSFYNSVPTKINFEIQEDRDSIILRAKNYGKIGSYGNGAIFVKRKHFEEYLKEKQEVKMNKCKTCRHYQMWLMIQKPYHYCGEIPCTTCVHFNQPHDNYEPVQTTHNSDYAKCNCDSTKTYTDVAIICDKCGHVRK